MATLDPVTNTVIYNDKEQFDNEYDNFGNRTSSLVPSVDTPTGLDTVATNSATDPTTATSGVDSQSTSEVSLVEGYLQSSNFVDYYVDPVNAAGWQINSDGSVQFNNGLFRGTLTVGGNAWHVDINGNMWWGPSTTYAGATIRISSAGSVNFTTGNFSGNLAAPTGTIGGWTIGAITLTGGGVTLDSNGIVSGGIIETSTGIGQRVVMSGVSNNLIFYDSSNKPRAELDGTGLILLNSIGAQSTIINTDADGLTLTGAGGTVFIGASGGDQLTADTLYALSSVVAGVDITLGGVTRTTWPSGGTTTLSGLTIDVAKNWAGYGITSLGTLLPSGDASYNLGSVGNSWALGYIGQIKGGTVNDNTIDLSSEAANILTNKNFIPSSDNSVTSGSAGRRWSDLRSVLINGVSFLSEKNVIRELNDYDFLSNMPRVIEFTWKVTNEANQGKTFWGFAADDLPSTIADVEGKSANIMGAIAYAYGAIKQLREEIILLKAK